VDPPDGTYSTGDVWTVIKKGFGIEMGAEVKNTDGYLQTGYGAGKPSPATAWFNNVVREHHKVEPGAEDKITVPYSADSHSTAQLPDTTPQKLYATVRPRLAASPQRAVNRVLFACRCQLRARSWCQDIGRYHSSARLGLGAFTDSRAAGRNGGSFPLDQRRRSGYLCSREVSESPPSCQDHDDSSGSDV
jgi:hypothetical protein